MEDCIKHIKSCRPNLSESSIKTYCNVLRNLYRDIWTEDFDYTKFIKEQPKVLKQLENVKFNVRKTILSALVVISEKKIQQTYRDMMVADAHQYNALQKTNKMTDAQRENWMSWEQIEEYLAKLKSKFYYIFKEAKPTKEEILNLQKYVILACYVLMPPRRCQDYAEMKTKAFDVNKDNFYSKGHFFFNKYKTAKFSGKQIEKLPKAFEMLLSKWVKFHDNEYLFTDYYDKPLTSSGMTKILNSIFKPRNISVNQLRHIYITEKSAPLMKQLEDTAKAMGHSTEQAKLYVKE